jgi:hypothetical protein
MNKWLTAVGLTIVFHANLVFAVSYNVKDYGAVGNGITDDTQAIKNAILAAGNSDKVYFPSGIYYISQTLSLTYDNQTWYGDGMGASVIKAVGNFSPAVVVGSGSAVPISPSIRSLIIRRDLQGADKTGVVGLWYWQSKHPTKSVFEEVKVYGNYYNLMLGGSGYYPMSNTSWNNCEFGSYEDSAFIAVYHVGGIEQIFSSCRVEGFTYAGYYKLDGDSRFDNCYIGSVAAAFGSGTPSYCVEMLGGVDTHFTGCVFEQGGVSDIRIRGGMIISITGCLIGGGGNTGHGLILYPDCAEIKQVVIANNSIKFYAQAGSFCPGTGGAIYLNDNSTTYKASQIAISNNNIDVQGIFAVRLDGGSDTTVAANTFYYRGNNPNAIYLCGLSNRVAVTGNTIYMSGTGYSVFLATSTSNNVVTGNVITGGTFQNNNATGNLVESNIIR